MVQNNRFIGNINRIPTSYATKPKPVINPEVNRFDDILKSEIDGNKQVKFSKHAEMRLKDRDIDLSESQIAKITIAVNKAEQKGVKDSLILMDTFAFVVNIRNRTVITAASKDELKENVFTNIDGAVVV